MADIVDKATRSRMMSGIKGKNTKPELTIRHFLHKAGYRYRLHVKELPGKPDLVFPKHKAVLFINGCFWHGHNCHLFKIPSTRKDFWQEKILRNASRDREVFQKLKDLDWRVGVIWECSLKGRDRLKLADILTKISLWLNSDDYFLEVRGQC
ncbi:very short patch repair endonuclease [Labrenzia sp. CP4]|uniref:very short patch repair endonuclease n=1 Tax=Labrenzia sp. CP4 TaxID=1674922 RepID=UPI0009EEB5E9|nr:very short patch repair endonuclease [Labrenzia sp. CP4]